MIEQARLASLGELSSGIAHEINQPLHNILFTINNMNKALDTEKADRDYLKKKIDYIAKDINRMKKIIDHVRIFSRSQNEDKKENFDINESIQNAVNLIRKQYSEKEIEIFLELSKKLQKVYGNPFKFEQVVLNLFSNARDALLEKAKTIKFRKKILIKSYQEKSGIILEVEDNGIGILSENKDKLFHPFYTTKEPGKGTGLGLSISYGIIKEMGGTIYIQSKNASGSIIQISLPNL